MQSVKVYHVFFFKWRMIEIGIAMNLIDLNVYSGDDEKHTYMILNKYLMITILKFVWPVY